MVTAYQGSQVDAIVQFDVLSGRVAVRRPELQHHRRRGGAPSPDLDAHGQGPVRRQARPPGTRPDVRPAGAHPAAVQGQGPARQRPRHLAGLSVLRPVRPAAGTGHRQGQAAPVGRRRGQPDGRPSMRASCSRSPTSRPCSRARQPRPGITLNVAVESLDTFYGAQWCPAKPADPPCSGAAELGIVDYGHRGDPGRLPQRGTQDARASGTRRSTRPRRSMRRSRNSRPPSASTPRRRPATRSRRSCVEDTPIGLPYFYNYLAGTRRRFTGVYSSALGQMFFSSASKSA